MQQYQAVIYDSNSNALNMANVIVTGSLGATSLSINGNSLSTIPIELPYLLVNQADYSVSPYRFCNMTGAMTLYGPTNPHYGAIWTCYIFSSGGSYNLSFPVDVLIPSDSGFTSPKTLSANKTYVVQMRYGLSMSGTNWLLNSVVGGY